MTRAAHQGGLTRPGPAPVPSRYQTVPACVRIIRFTRLYGVHVYQYAYSYKRTVHGTHVPWYPSRVQVSRPLSGWGDPHEYFFFTSTNTCPWSNMSDNDLERIVHLVGCGVPGAIKVLAHVRNTCPQYASMLPAHGLVGSRLWTFYKDICGQDMAVMQAALQKLQRGIPLADVCARTLGSASASASSPASAPATAQARASASASASASATASAPAPGSASAPAPAPEPSLMR